MVLVRLASGSRWPDPPRFEDGEAFLPAAPHLAVLFSASANCSTQASLSARLLAGQEWHSLDKRLNLPLWPPPPGWVLARDVGKWPVEGPLLGRQCASQVITPIPVSDPSFNRWCHATIFTTSLYCCLPPEPPASETWTGFCPFREGRRRVNSTQRDMPPPHIFAAVAQPTAHGQQPSVVTNWNTPTLV